jgi:hypothetical protein
LIPEWWSQHEEVKDARDRGEWGDIIWVRAPEIGSFKGAKPKLFDGEP